MNLAIYLPCLLPVVPWLLGWISASSMVLRQGERRHLPDPRAVVHFTLAASGPATYPPPFCLVLAGRFPASLRLIEPQLLTRKQAPFPCLLTQVAASNRPTFTMVRTRAIGTKKHDMELSLQPTSTS